MLWQGGRLLYEATCSNEENITMIEILIIWLGCILNSCIHLCYGCLFQGPDHQYSEI